MNGPRSQRPPGVSGFGSLVGAVVVIVLLISASAVIEPLGQGEDQRFQAGGGGGSEDVMPAPSAPLPVDVLDLAEKVEREPWDQVARLELANLLADLGEFEVAAAHYEQYLTYNSSSQAVWNMLATVYASDGAWDKVADTNRRLLARFPRDDWAMYNLGAALANQGYYDDARTWLTRAVEQGRPDVARRAASAMERLADR